MKVSLYIWWLGMLWMQQVTAQSFTFQRTVRIPLAQQVSVDRYKNIYLADQKGNVIQYNVQGDSLRTFSPLKLGDISLLEAWPTVRIFVFYKDFQEYLYLNRFLTPSERIAIDERYVGFARVATLSPDNGIWAFDDTDFSLKKYNPQLQTLQVNTPCDLLLNAQDYNLQFIKEYQNQVFLCDQNSGILIFDNLGNFKKKLYLRPSTNIGFWNDWIYFVDEQKKLSLQHIYSTELKQIDLPIEQSYNQVIFMGDTVVLLDKSKMHLYHMK
ncbi:MAG: hypothetical protein ACFB0B_10645 [Thermonemataceae bacterium]